MSEFSKPEGNHPEGQTGFNGTAGGAQEGSTGTKAAPEVRGDGEGRKEWRKETKSGEKELKKRGTSFKNEI